MIISYGVCDQLDEMKHTYHGLPDFLTKVTCPCSCDTDTVTIVSLWDCAVQTIGKFLTYE